MYGRSGWTSSPGSGQAAQGPNYYEILGVLPEISAAELTSCYRRLSCQYHPDRNVDKSEAEKRALLKRYQEMVAAYQVLSDPRRREEYDVARGLNFRSRAAAMKAAIQQRNERLQSSTLQSGDSAGTGNGRTVDGSEISKRAREEVEEPQDEDEDDDEEYCPGPFAECSSSTGKSPSQQTTSPHSFFVVPITLVPNSGVDASVLAASGEQQWKGITLQRSVTPQDVTKKLVTDITKDVLLSVWGLSVKSLSGSSPLRSTSASSKRMKLGTVAVERSEGLTAGKVPFPSVVVQADADNCKSRSSQLNLYEHEPGEPGDSVPSLSELFQGPPGSLPSHERKQEEATEVGNTAGDCGHDELHLLVTYSRHFYFLSGPLSSLADTALTVAEELVPDVTQPMMPSLLPNTTVLSVNMVAVEDGESLRTVLRSEAKRKVDGPAGVGLTRREALVLECPSIDDLSCYDIP